MIRRSVKGNGDEEKMSVQSRDLATVPKRIVRGGRMLKPDGSPSGEGPGTVQSGGRPENAEVFYITEYRFRAAQQRYQD